MKIEKFLELTESPFSGQYPGGAGGDSTNVRGGTTGKMKEWYTAITLPEVNKFKDPDRFDDIINVLKNALIELPKYGLVTSDSSEWKSFVNQTNDKIQNTITFNSAEVTAIMNGLLFWIAPLKEIGQNNDSAYTGSKNFAAEALRNNVSDITREPLRIIDSINRTGQLFPGKNRWPVQAGEPLGRKSHEAGVAKDLWQDPLADSGYTIGNMGKDPTGKPMEFSNRTAENMRNMVGPEEFEKMARKVDDNKRKDNEPPRAPITI